MVVVEGGGFGTRHGNCFTAVRLVRVMCGITSDGLVGVVCGFAGFKVAAEVGKVGTGENGKGESNEKDVGEVHFA